MALVLNAQTHATMDLKNQTKDACQVCTGPWVRFPSAARRRGKRGRDGVLCTVQFYSTAHITCNVCVTVHECTQNTSGGKKTLTSYDLWAQENEDDGTAPQALHFLKLVSQTPLVFKNYSCLCDHSHTRSACETKMETLHGWERH